MLDTHDKKEVHYYKERYRTISEIHDPEMQKKIDQHIQTHQYLPPYNTAKESGYSSIGIATTKEININPSMVEKLHDSDSMKTIIRRLANPPALPVSCMATAEHVIALGNQVTDFVSEYQPKEKHQVVFQILVRSLVPNEIVSEAKSRLLRAILKHDPSLNKKDIRVMFCVKRKLYVIELNTQKGDVEETIKSIKKSPFNKIMDCDFSEVNLNEGLCLIKTSSPEYIHALVNIADSKVQKGFIERDAGLTSGLGAHRYQDRCWTFNFYKSLDHLKQETHFPSDSHAVKLTFKP